MLSCKHKLAKMAKLMFRAHAVITMERIALFLKTEIKLVSLCINRYLFLLTSVHDKSFFLKNQLFINVDGLIVTLLI